MGDEKGERVKPERIEMFKKTCNYLIPAFAITYLFWGFDIVLSCLSLYEHPAYNVGIIFYIIAAWGDIK